MKKALLGFCLLALSSLSFAGMLPKPSPNPQADDNAEVLQQKMLASKAEPRSQLATDQCSFTFTSGANNTAVEYCVTANGNIPEFQFPKGFSLISPDRREGYGICDTTGQTKYFDFASSGDSGNWNSATVVSHSETSVKIIRTTSDGIWTLTQTITRSGSPASAKIVMSLKNNTAITREALLLRYTDVDVNGNAFNNFDGTFDSAFGWNSIGGSNGAGATGMVLQNAGNLPTTDFSGFAQNTPSPPDPCNVTANFASKPLINQDGSLVLAYVLFIPGSKSNSVTLSYRGL